MAHMLVLFDIDGTLLELPSLIHDRAIELACAGVFDVQITVPDTRRWCGPPLVAAVLWSP